VPSDTPTAEYDDAPTGRLWIVSLLARSAAVIADNKLLNIVASPESTVPVVAIRLRNQVCLSTDEPAGPTFVGGLVAEAAGVLADATSAVDLLANLASPYFQAVALAVNAAVDEAQDVFAFAPPRDPSDIGEYIVQKASHQRSPAPAIRQIEPELLMELLQALGNHVREDRLHRALAHYRMALNHLEPRNWVLAAESLYIAVENLARVIFLRLLREAELPDTGEGKHHLALLHGHRPRDDDDRSHLGRLDSWIREHFVFGDNRPCYKDLLDASDGFEHGYDGFDKVRNRATRSTQRAFGYIRRAVLREIGIAEDSALLGPKFDIPLGDWRPVLQLSGTYTDTADKPGPGFTPDDFRDDWPDFHGPTVMPRISRVIDNPDGSRTLDLTLQAHGDLLSATQTIDKRMTTDWILPSGKEDASPRSGEITRVLFNGEDITERWRAEQELNESDADNDSGHTP